MELSDNNEYLAVSYQQLKDDKSKSYIELFVNKHKDKHKNYGKIDEKIFEHYAPIPCPYKDRAYRTPSGVSYGFAAYCMAFAESDSKTYFLIYFQLMDEHQNRLAVVGEEEQERDYTVWDVASSTVIANSALIESIRWKKLYLHNSLAAKYLFHQRALTPRAAHPDTPPSNNNLLLPEFTNMVLLSTYLLLSSVNGDLHVVGLGTL